MEKPWNCACSNRQDASPRLKTWIMKTKTLDWQRRNAWQTAPRQFFYAFSRCFHPKRLTVHSGYTFFVSTCVPWELNAQPFALLTQCSTTKPQEHCVMYLRFNICNHCHANQNFHLFNTLEWTITQSWTVKKQAWSQTLLLRKTQQNCTSYNNTTQYQTFKSFRTQQMCTETNVIHMCSKTDPTIFDILWLYSFIVWS